MSEQIEAKGGIMHPSQPQMPSMVAPTFSQRMCELLHKPVTVVLANGGTAPLTGTLHAVGQDYLELMNSANNKNQVMIVPLWNVGLVMAAGAMNDICPTVSPTVCPPTVSPGCPVMPGGDVCPPMMGPGMMGPGMMGPGMKGPGMMGPGGMMGGMPGMMDIKDVKEEKK